MTTFLMVLYQFLQCVCVLRIECALVEPQCDFQLPEIQHPSTDSNIIRKKKNTSENIRIFSSATKRYTSVFM